MKKVMYAMWSTFYLGIYGFSKALKGESVDQMLGYVDTLTRALNRKAFVRRMKSFFTGSIIMIDLDNFKKYNDMNGHDEGDKLLISVVSTVNAAIKAYGTLYRMAGDEFFVLTHIRDELTLGFLCDIIKSNVNKYTNITISLGTIITPNLFDQREDLDFLKYNKTLLRTVDQALYTAKRKGKNQVHHGAFSILPQLPVTVKVNNNKGDLL